MFALGDKVIGNPTVAALRGVRLVRAAAARRVLRPDRRPCAVAAGADRGRSGADLPRHARLALDWLARSRWRSSASACSSPASSARCSRPRPCRCCSRSSCPCRSGYPPRRSPTGSPAGRSRRPRRCRRSCCSGRHPSRDPLRAAAGAACRALAARLRADAAFLLGAADELRAEPRRGGGGAGRRGQERSPRRSWPRRTGPPASARPRARSCGWSTSSRWLQARSGHGAPASARGRRRTRLSCAVKLAAAAVLERAADLLDGRRSRGAARRGARELRAALERVETATAVVRRAAPATLVSALDPALPRPGARFAVFADRRRRRRPPPPPTAGRWLERLMGRHRPSVGTSRRRRCAPALAPRAALGLAPQQPPRRRASRARRPRREPDRRPALVLGHPRHALGAALERAQHGPERRARARSERRPASSSAPACSR